MSRLDLFLAAVGVAAMMLLQGCGSEAHAAVTNAYTTAKCAGVVDDIFTKEEASYIERMQEVCKVLPSETTTDATTGEKINAQQKCTDAGAVKEASIDADRTFYQAKCEAAVANATAGVTARRLSDLSTASTANATALLASLTASLTSATTFAAKVDAEVAIWKTENEAAIIKTVSAQLDAFIEVLKKQQGIATVPSEVTTAPTENATVAETDTPNVTATDAATDARLYDAETPEAKPKPQTAQGGPSTVLMMSGAAGLLLVSFVVVGVKRMMASSTREVDLEMVYEDGLE